MGTAAVAARSPTARPTAPTRPTPTVAPSPRPSPTPEPRAVSGPPTVRLTPTVQRGEAAAAQERSSGGLLQWVGDAVGNAVGDAGWELVNQTVPQLVPILRQGPIEWIKQQVLMGVEAIFTSLMRPLRAVRGVVEGLTGHFTNLLDWLREAGARIARGDCGALTEAAERIQQVFESLTSPAVERIRELVDQTNEFFSGLWDQFGAPVWEFLQEMGGAAWERIQQLGSWIGEGLGAATGWVMERLGIEESAEGEGGIMDWIQRQAQAVWDEHIGPFYERYREPILIVAGVLVMLSPAGPYIAIAAAVAGLIAGIQWIRRNLRNRDEVVAQRGYLEGVIIPGIMRAVDRTSDFISEKAQWIVEKLTEVVSGLTQAAGAVAGTILGFVVGLLQWVIDRFQELVRWAVRQLPVFAQWVQDVLERVRAFFEPVRRFLVGVNRAVRDVMQLGAALGDRLWNAVPACLRDPFIDFFVPMILRQIPLFRELGQNREAWQETRAQVTDLIRQVFRDFDLMGAIRTAFDIVLRVLRIPVDLVRELWDKAQQAWDSVMRAPLQFVENALRAGLQGMGRFITNILSHLGFGIQGWLFNAVGQSGLSISPPSSWTDFRAVFGFVLDVLGISVDHVIDLIDRRIPGSGQVLRRAIDWLTEAVEWLQIAYREGPSGLWRYLVDRLSNLGTALLEGAVGWVMQRVIEGVSVRVTAMAASGGWSAVLEAVRTAYSAIQTAVEYAQRILRILVRAFDTVQQIATGNLGPAAAMVENGLRMAMPVAIGFLANWLGLGGVGMAVVEIIRDLRERIDNAILGLIDRVLARIRGVVDRIRSGASRLASRALGGDPTATPQQRLQDGVREGVQAVNRLPGSRIGIAMIRPVLETIRLRHDLRSLQAEARNGRWAVVGVVNPTLAELTQKDAEAAAAAVTLGAPQYFSSRNPAGWGTGMLALRRRPFSRGSRPSVTNGQFDDLNIRRDGNATSTSTASYYVLGHLLNERLGGPGNTWGNLTPLSRRGNAQHETQVENQVKTAVDQGKTMRYEVRVMYRRAASPLLSQIPANATDSVSMNKRKVLMQEQHVASGMHCEVAEVDPSTLQPLAGGVAFSRDVANPVEAGSLADYNVPGQARLRLQTLALNDSIRNSAQPLHEQALKSLPGIGEARYTELVSRTYPNWQAIWTQIDGITEERVAGWRAGLPGNVRVILNGTTTWI